MPDFYVKCKKCHTQTIEKESYAKVKCHTLELLVPDIALSVTPTRVLDFNSISYNKNRELNTMGVYVCPYLSVCVYVGV